MKNTLLAFISVLIWLPLFSQTADSIQVLQSPAGRLSGLIDIQDLVNEGFNYWEDEFEGHWSGIELGVNGLTYPDYSMYPANENNFLRNDLIRSNVLNLNLLQYSRGLQQTRNNVGLITGLGLSLKSYHLKSRTTILIDNNFKVYPDDQFFDSNQKSKLSSVYLEVPLLVEFQIPVKNYPDRMYISAGIIGSKRLETHTKVKYRKDGKRQKLKSPGDYSIRDYKLAGTLRMGYRWINLFATYDVVPLFEDRKGPVLYPVSVGLVLLSF